MAITFVAAGTLAENFGKTIEIALPAGWAENDLLIIVCAVGDNQSLVVNEAGWTEQEEAISSVASDNALIVSTKIALSTESGTYTVDITGVSDRTIKGFMLAYRGEDLTTEMDAAATKVVDTFNTDTHDPAAITTVTANSFVVSCVCATQADDGTAVEPSGYTLRKTGGTTSLVVAAADIGPVTPAGEEDPPTWSALGSTADHSSITIAIRPAVAAGANPKGPLGHPLIGPFGGPI